eukprot:GHVU01030308.1.p2 GENE.GHVU01030308.1~~GHVU01030308.1.p2  ORF type:complete len:136 (+),score=17.31 GHVU01030308.1:952-1359(+)
MGGAAHADSAPPQYTGTPRAVAAVAASKGSMLERGAADGAPIATRKTAARTTRGQTRPNRKAKQQAAAPAGKKSESPETSEMDMRRYQGCWRAWRRKKTRLVYKAQGTRRCGPPQVFGCKHNTHRRQHKHQHREQ